MQSRIMCDWFVPAASAACLPADVDECMLGLHSCSGPSSRCNNTVGSFNCVCDDPAYMLDPNNKTNCIGELVLCMYMHLSSLTMASTSTAFLKIAHV